MSDLDDWANYLLKVEKSLKKMEDKLLHKDYDGIYELNEKIVDNLNKTMVWVFKEMRKVEQ
jgi:HD superfamily phosphodiesterase